MHIYYNFINTKTAITLYYSLMCPYLNYCNLPNLGIQSFHYLTSFTNSPEKKSSSRVASRLPRDTHVEPIPKQLKKLKVHKINEFHAGDLTTRVHDSLEMTDLKVFEESDLPTQRRTSLESSSWDQGRTPGFY